MGFINATLLSCAGIAATTVMTGCNSGPDSDVRKVIDLEVTVPVSTGAIDVRVLLCGQTYPTDGPHDWQPSTEEARGQCASGQASFTDEFFVASKSRDANPVKQLTLPCRAKWWRADIPTPRGLYKATDSCEVGVVIKTTTGERTMMADARFDAPPLSPTHQLRVEGERVWLTWNP